MRRWRAEDEELLQRLEDETVAFELFASLVSSYAAQNTPELPAAALAGRLHPRAAGLIAELRKCPSGAAAVAAAMTGDTARLAHLVDSLDLKNCAPELLHHLAVFQAKVAMALEVSAPELAASAWGRSLAAWLALGEERSYLVGLEELVLGNSALRSRSEEQVTSPAIDLISEIARRADASARDLAPAGRAALLALTRTDEAARIAGASPSPARRVRMEAERRRTAAIDAALAVIADGLEEANVRGELASSGRMLLLRATSVWTWTSNDEAVEHFVVEWIDKIGWELYRARRMDVLRDLLDPFRPMFESLASRIERDPSKIAYAAACAQMFVFLAETEHHMPRKLEVAERAVKICPTHRNGRLVLASVLCDEAINTMQSMVVFAKRSELERVHNVLERAESLHPQTSGLPDAKQMLERVKKGRIAV